MILLFSLLWFESKESLIDFKYSFCSAKSKSFWSQYFCLANNLRSPKSANLLAITLLSSNRAADDVRLLGTCSLVIALRINKNR